MSLLFSNNKNYESKYKLKIIDENFNPESSFFDMQLILGNYYNDIMQENLSICHFGNIYQDENIMMESLSTFKEKVSKFFKYLGEKLQNLWNKLKQFYHKMTMSTVDYITKYKSEILDKDWQEFIYNGYKFTFNDKVPSLSPVMDLISNYNSRLNNDIKSLEKNEFDFNGFRKELLGEDKMNQIRGKILGLKSVEKGEFEHRCTIIYRDDKKESEPILVNKDMVGEIISSYNRLENTHKMVTVQFSNLDSALKQLQKYFESAKTVEYSGDEKKIKVNKVHIENDKFSRDKDEISANYDSSTLERINRYYTILFQCAKEICNSTSMAIVKKATALKDCLTQYDKILKQTLNKGKEVYNNENNKKEGEK